jgi:hypothetical protein
LLDSGKVGKVRLAAAGVRLGAAGAGVDVESIVVVAHDVSIDRDQLTGHRRVVLTGVGHGDVRVAVTGDAISSALGVPGVLARVNGRVAFRDGAIVVDLPGIGIAAVADAQGPADAVPADCHRPR